MKRPIICKDTGETFMLYKDYLKSKHWINLKKRYRESKLDQFCYVCRTKDKLHLHHKSYKRIGEEHLNDLIYLCGECHQFAHERLKEPHSQKVNLWTIARRMRKAHDSKQSTYSVKNYDLSNGVPDPNTPTTATLTLKQIEIVINNKIDHYLLKVKSGSQEINVQLTNKEMLEVYRTFKEGRKRNKQKASHST